MQWLLGSFIACLMEESGTDFESCVLPSGHMIGGKQQLCFFLVNEILFLNSIANDFVTLNGCNVFVLYYLDMTR